MALGFVLFYIAVSLALPRGYLLTAFGDLSQCLLLLAATWFALANIGGSGPRAKLFWALLSLGCGLWLGSQALWTYLEVVLQREVPNPFSGDVVLFLHLVPLMGALAVRPDLERREPSRGLGVLAFVLLLTWWLYLYVFVVLPWQFVSPNEALYGRSFNVVFFLEHAVFVGCAGAVWWRSQSAWHNIYGHLFGASALYACGSIASCVAIDYGKYYTGSFYDLPVVCAMAWIAVMGFGGRKMALPTELFKTSRNRRDLWVPGLAMITNLTLPVMAAWAVYFSHAPARVRSFRLLLTLLTMMVMGTLTWIKHHRLNKELARTNQELREDSLTDVLTGARNRRYLDSILEADVRQVVRTYSAPAQNQRNRDLVFYIIDTDGFKEVNDRYGHDVGDKLLVGMARRISAAIRHSDVLIRWGGDEFLVVSRYTERRECLNLPARVLNAVGREAFEYEGVRIRCTCSIGWAVFPWFVQAPEAVGYEEVLRLADRALYEAKKAGRNQAVGMLPTRETPDPIGTASLHKKLTDHLEARSVTTPGPAGDKADSDVQRGVKAKAAGQGN